jgi:hypothetical protein
MRVKASILLGHYRMYCTQYLAHGTQSDYRICYPSDWTGDTPGSSILIGLSYLSGSYTRLNHG